jgi:hypothetical protein
MIATMVDRGNVRVVVAGLLVCLTAGFAHATTPEASPAGPRTAKPRNLGDKKNQVLLGPEAVNHGADVMAAWTAYGAQRATAYEKTPPPPANTSADDYALELEGRTAQNKIWKELRGKGAKAYPMLDRQVEIWEAGFLPELLISIYARPGWTIPGPTITALRLHAFGERFTGSYDHSLAVAVISSSGAKFPPVPGGDFPDPERLPLGPASCGQLLDERAAAWRRWDALEPQLGGVPVAAVDSVKFAAALDSVKNDPTYLKRGATWVSWRVGSLALLEGFCAVETRDWPRAVSMLTRAVGMMPQEHMPRLELGTALVMVKRFDEALAQDRAVIDSTTDGCLVATALRHEGYTYIDMGLLDSARLAYEKSLEVEPANALATKELKIVMQGLAQRHHNPKAAGRYAPPPLSTVTISKCIRKAP